MKAHRIYSLLTRWQRFNGFTERERESIVELVAGIVSEAKRDDLASLRAECNALREHLRYWIPDEAMIPAGHEAAWDAARAAIDAVKQEQATTTGEQS